MNRLTGSAARAWIILALVFAAVFRVVRSGVCLLALSEPVAAAQMVSAPVHAAVGGGVVKADSDTDGQAVGTDLNIPMFRWMGATQSFNYQTDGNPVGAAARASERTVYYGLPMMIGNVWLASSSLLDGAVGFKPMNIVGLQIDQAAAKVGTAIIASPLLSAAFIMVALGTVVGLKRGERPWRRVWTTSPDRRDLRHHGRWLRERSRRTATHTNRV